MTAAGEAASTSVPDSATPDAGLQTPGALLQQERIRRGLSVQQSAEGLHLDPWIIEAIEANHFLALGAPVYAKGYLRKYAALLGLAPDVIVARYEVLSDTPAVPTPIPVITTTPPPRPKWPKYLGWGVLTALVIAIGFVAFKFLMPAPVGPTPSQAPVAEDVPAAVQVPAPEAPVTSAAPTPTERPRVTVPTTQPVVSPPAPRAEPAPANATPVDASTAVRLRLEFTEPSWVEVYDANGQRLLYDIGQPNRARVVSGAPPLNVVVGVASAVSVQVNDQAIVVPRQANKDSTRFRVAADGSVR